MTHTPLVQLGAGGSAQIVDQDFYGPQGLSDPVPVYHAMLAAGPVVWLSRQCLHAICGHSAATAALRRPDLFISGEGVSIDQSVNSVIKGSTLNSDRPAHDQTRAITFAPLTPKALAGVTDVITQAAETIADHVAASDTIDAAAEVAPFIPLTVVRDLVGLGPDGHDRMLEWGAATFELMGDPRDRRAVAQSHLSEMRAFLEDPDVLDRLAPTGWARRAIAAGAEAGLPHARARELMRDYIAPSLDTTISAIGYGLHLFAQHPAQWAKLCHNRGLMGQAIEEIVRLNTPIRTFSRVVAQDLSLAGTGLKANERVLVVFGAANRDPAAFADPDAFEITRPEKGHLGFGHRVHACLGMHLARLEMAALFGALADRGLRFAPNGPAVSATNSTIRALARIPLRVAR